MIVSILSSRVPFNSTYASDWDLNTINFNIDDTRSTNKIDVLCDPSSKIKLAHKVWSFMVTTNKYRSKWSLFLTCKILLKWAHTSIFWRTRHCLKIFMTSQSLKVAAAKNKVNFYLILSLPVNKLSVHFVKFAMKTSNNCNI